MMKKINLLLLLTAAMTGVVYAQQSWQMKPVVLQTRWAKEVNQMHTHEGYPRPNMTRKNWTNLNGLWSYAITKKEEQPTSYDKNILVPYPIESALSGVMKGLQPDENLWYKRTFTSPSGSSWAKTLLHFGAVDWQATIFINGQEAGSHSGGYTAFTVDITDKLKKGTNEIVVKVFDPSDRGIGPHGKQVLNPGSIYYTPSSGIWQTVWLENVPRTYITAIKTTPDIDKGELRLNVTLNDAKANQQIDAIVTTNGKQVAIWHGKHNDENSVYLKMPNARLWSPDHPFLYDLTVRLKQYGKIVDEVKSYFGMRKISIQKDNKGIDRISLNNEPYYNLGVLDQGFWPEGLYTAPTDEALAFDIKAIKAMGFNTIRKHIKVEPARWYYDADKIGMLVWQDMVNPNQNLPEGAKAAFEQQCKETLEQLHNYPSITTWVLFNEKWGQYDQERLTKWVKETDPSRIVNGHSGEYLYVNEQLRSPSPNAYVNADMTDVHSYPNPMMSIKQSGKAQVCGEFGGIGVPIEGHLWDDLVVGWGYDGLVTPKQMESQFESMINILVRLKQHGLSGSIYTQPYDVESEQNGLMTYDRELSKLPLETIRKIQAKLNPPTTSYAVATQGLELKPVKDESKSYQERQAAFEAGKRDSVLLRSLTIMAGQQKDISKTEFFCNEYVRQLKNPFLETNLQFIVRYTIHEDSPAFGLMINNLAKAESVLGNRRAAYKVQEIIFNDEVKPLLNDKPDWSAIDAILKKYPQTDGEFVIGNAVVFYLGKLIEKDQNALNPFVEIATTYDDRFNAGSYNLWAWYTFVYSNDQGQLIKALRWIDKDIERKTKDPDLHYSLDTKAHVLYKLGRIEEAIALEKEALKLLPDQQEYKDALAKMEKGAPTWK
ncbi:sugar-binding domain-containing protein [Mucilaginibacter dorajii]|nr:sugar-binding domain-containing protein [Mucilaginibacter dorajii]MCS3732592.1 tetratricopeptide (TPR) repeat protein [Mucilaginibacter dorajii]